MDVESLIGTYGGPGLLVIAFIAATIIPLSSEAAVAAAITYDFPPIEALVWASVGNCLGVTLNYWLGRLGRKTIDRRNPDKLAARAVRWFERYGKWGLVLSFLPFIGDPLTLVAGIIRVNFLFFVAVVYSVRVLRYWLLIVAAS